VSYLVWCRKPEGEETQASSELSLQQATQQASAMSRNDPDSLYRVRDEHTLHRVAEFQRGKFVLVLTDDDMIGASK
jgi:hypothetical protein